MEPRNARDETWPAHLFDESWCKIKRRNNGLLTYLTKVGVK